MKPDDLLYSFANFSDNADLQEALLRPRECGQEKLSPMMQPTIQRKVSFRETTHGRFKMPRNTTKSLTDI